MTKSISGIIGLVVVILSIPLIAMQFTDEVLWDVYDFLLAGFLLFSTAVGVHILRKKVTSRVWFALLISILLLLLLLLLLLWAELAVGIFGTPLGGN